MAEQVMTLKQFLMPWQVLTKTILNNWTGYDFKTILNCWTGYDFKTILNARTGCDLSQA